MLSVSSQALKTTQPCAHVKTLEGYLPLQPVYCFEPFWVNPFVKTTSMSVRRRPQGSLVDIRAQLYCRHCSVCFEGQDEENSATSHSVLSA